MGEVDVFGVTLLCAGAGVVLGAVLGFLNGWARVRFAGELKQPPWLESGSERCKTGDIIRL